MTALKKYERLESPGLWRETPDSQRREVVVGFRDATLVLFDPRNDMPLSHWSLPAIERLNGSDIPAIFAPSTEAEESLEIEDSMMIAAIEQVLRSVHRASPRPGRLRGSILGGALIAVLAVGTIYLPDAIRSHTATVLPAATRLAIGTAALADVTRLTGAPCSTPLGTRALGIMADRLFGTGAPTVLVLRDGAKTTANLPGRITILPRDLVETIQSPDALAGYVLAETRREQTKDPLIPVLDHIGLIATVRLLATGTLPDGALSGYGEVVLRQTPAPVADDAMLAAFQTAQVSSAPYGYALDATGETTLGLIEADPYRKGSPRAVLDIADWQALQSICMG